jgi:hypothetical protein
MSVFICYRREDSAAFARLIYDRLTKKLARDSVFLDVDNTPPGLDFVEILSERIGKCDALVAVIGKSWLSSAYPSGRRRLDDPTDLVRVEIEAALAREIRVIPVLVDGAAMPRAEDLPDSMKTLTRRQGIEISHTRFGSDIERLTRALSSPSARRGQRNRLIVTGFAGASVLAAAVLFVQLGGLTLVLRQREEVRLAPTSLSNPATPAGQDANNKMPASESGYRPPPLEPATPILQRAPPSGQVVTTKDHSGVALPEVLSNASPAPGPTPLPQPVANAEAPIPLPEASTRPTTGNAHPGGPEIGGGAMAPSGVSFDIQPGGGEPARLIAQDLKRKFEHAGFVFDSERPTIIYDMDVQALTVGRVLDGPDTVIVTITKRWIDPRKQAEQPVKHESYVWGNPHSSALKISEQLYSLLSPPVSGQTAP